MRVAALALVLIIASAVVLIFANTLNSWVLGGLIGGLAALLISIPISLIIFATLARRQDERLYANMLLQQEDELAYYEEEDDRREYADGNDYDEYDEYGRVYEAEAYYLPDDEDVYELPRGRRQPEIRSLPAAGQSYASSSTRATARQRALDNAQNVSTTQNSRKITREFALDRERSREAPASQQNRQTGHQRTARTPSTTRSLRSQQQAAARRVAQQEAAQGTHRSEQASTGPVRRPATTRHLPPQSIQLNRSRLADESRSQSETSRSAKKPSNAGDGRPHETQTDQISGRYPYPATGPIRPNPETGYITRRQVNAQNGEDELTTGSLRNPLVRRAPYLYEDDPLREELSQQIDKPITRRASRYLSIDEEQ